MASRSDQTWIRRWLSGLGWGSSPGPSVPAAPTAPAGPLRLNVTIQPPVAAASVHLAIQ